MFDLILGAGSGSDGSGPSWLRRRVGKTRRRWPKRCCGARFHTGLGQGGSPQHGELHWVHRVGDWGFAGARRGEGRRRFAGEQFSPDSEGAHGKRSTDNFLTLVCGFASMWPSQRGSRAPGPWWRGGAPAPGWRSTGKTAPSPNWWALLRKARNGGAQELTGVAA